MIERWKKLMRGLLSFVIDIRNKLVVVGPPLFFYQLIDVLVHSCVSNQRTIL